MDCVTRRPMAGYRFRNLSPIVTSRDHPFITLGAEKVGGEANSNTPPIFFKADSGVE